METDKLRLDPQQMEQKAGEFDARCTEFTELVTTSPALRNSFVKYPLQ